jgi:hypothetical protein
MPKFLCTLLLVEISGVLRNTWFSHYGSNEVDSVWQIWLHLPPLLLQGINSASLCSLTCRYTITLFLLGAYSPPRLFKNSNSGLTEYLLCTLLCLEAETEASAEGGVDWNTGGRVVT